MTSILNMFGRSPVKHLEKHMSVVLKCASALEPFFDAAFAQDWAAATDRRLTVAQLEHEADEIKRKVRLNMPRRLFMPVSRSDVLALVGQQDLIANKSKDIAGVILGRQMVFPEVIQSPYRTFLARCIDATRQASQAIHELDELQEAGFSGQEVKIIERMIGELAKIEHETDKLQIAIRADIFQIEKTLPPIDAMFLYQVIELTGTLADKAQNVGDRLQTLMSRWGAE